MRTPVEPPLLKDFWFNIEVAAVSTRNRFSVLFTSTIATGNRSQRCKGISDSAGGVCARSGGVANRQTRPALTNKSRPRRIRIIASRAALLPGRSVRELPCGYGETRHRREKAGTPSSLPWRAIEFQRQDRGERRAC